MCVRGEVVLSMSSPTSAPAAAFLLPEITTVLLVQQHASSCSLTTKKGLCFGHFQFQPTKRERERETW